MAHKLDGANGRVVLWHGPPGTGKTTAIRALAGAWREQARFQIVLDPETVFSSSSRMMSIILGDGDDSEEWRVLVLEDADNLVAKEGHDTQLASTYRFPASIWANGLGVSQADRHRAMA